MNPFRHIWRPRKVVLVFLRVTEQQREYRAVKCRMKDISPEQIAQATQFDTVEDIVKYFGKSVPYHLHVNGGGVLSRKIGNVPDFAGELIINGDRDDFFFCVYEDDQAMAASFFRRTLIEQELTWFTEQRLHLLGITAGYVPLYALGDDISIRLGYHVAKENGRISDFSRSEKETNRAVFNGNTVDGEQLLCAAVIRLYLFPDAHWHLPDTARFAAAQENYRQFNQFNRTGIIMIGGIFLLLTGNYFYTNYLNSGIAQLELDLSVSNESLSMLNRLEDEKTRKEQLVLSAGVNSPRFLAYYLDEIGRTVPAQINLQDLQVFPLEGKMKNKQKVEVQKQIIRIAGSTPGNEVLDDWIERIDRFEWVQAVELMNYMKTEGDRSDFLLVITLAG